MTEDAPFRRIAADLRAAITRGEYRPGHQLPTTRTLMGRYGVARQTAGNALHLLRAEGLITTLPGGGTYVRERQTTRRLARTRLSRAEREAGRGPFTSDAAHAGFAPEVRVEIRYEPADERTAQLLQLEPGAAVLVRDRLMLADGRPAQLATSRLPAELVRGTQIEDPDTGPGGTYARLDELGHGPDRYEELISARMPDPAEASVLQLTGGIPVILVTRTAYDRELRPVETNDMTLAADRYELLYELPAH